MEHLNKLILGSQSPRRRSLLSEAGFTFDTRKIDVDESFPDAMASVEVAEFLSKEKNKVYRKSLESQTVITADTVVILKGKILGKPKDEREATHMLKELSNEIHQVVTGVCISNSSETISFSSLTEVKTKELTIEEINHYITSYKPFDKAGAYGIQEWFGLIAIEWIKGSFYNVVGLPIDLVYKTLVEKFEIHPSNSRS